jgi:NAD(P)-dependent dehydrogenase (short-subunit alcohol dehydrogenase family)
LLANLIARIIHNRRGYHLRGHDGKKAGRKRHGFEPWRQGRIGHRRQSRDRRVDRGRVGRPEEIGWLIAYLGPDKVDFIQGSVIDIDGGATRSL